MKLNLLGRGLTVIVAVALGIVLSGCSRGNQQQVVKQLELTIWSPLDSEATFLPLIRDFQRENPAIKITYEEKDPGTYETESLNALASQEGPDIWLIRNDWVEKHR